MIQNNCFTSDLHEVFATETGTVYQSDRECCLFIDFAGKFCRYTFPQLCQLKKKVNSFDIEEMLLNPFGADIEIVSIAGSEHYYVLTAVEILSFRELLAGTYVMFELNHILRDQLQRIVV
ncbi:MAG: hypothetical protein INR69_14735 [Mucilaginibacter polytrichastri]|nr:hypothetical protein [Mucilaginibacter polytrichastri]